MNLCPPLSSEFRSASPALHQHLLSAHTRVSNILPFAATLTLPRTHPVRLTLLDSL